MSRVGRKPIEVPSGVKVEITAAKVRVQGPKGKLATGIPAGTKVAQQGNQIAVSLDSSIRLTERELGSRWGLIRSLIQNMIEGVVKGFERKIEVAGAGYRPQVQGNKLSMTLGFSHPVVIDLPEGINATATRSETGSRGDERHEIVLTGCDKAALGELAARIRRVKKADVYKGKGIRYAGEVVRRKAGKAAVASGTGTGGK